MTYYLRISSKFFDRITGTDVEVQNGSSTLHVVAIGHAVKIP